jgi:hypothetical protein
MTRVRAATYFGGLLVLMLASTRPAAAATITARSCSTADVSSAIASAADGDIVVVPTGNCTWTTTLSISGKGIHLRGQTKGSVNITHSAGNADLITVNTNGTSRNMEMSNLTFLAGSASGSAEYVHVTGTGKPALLHDNYFRSVNFTVDCVRWGAQGGVIWSNTFESLDADGSQSGCLQIKSDAGTMQNSWSTASTMGTADTNGTINVYVEDNTFKKILVQSIDVDDNMRAVIRYNTFDNSGFVYHGADTSPVGVRHVEVYNNTFVFTASGSGYNYPLNLNWWVYVRGGSGVWTDNVMPDIKSMMWGDKGEITMIVQNLRRNSGPYPCWTSYPAPHQIGQSSNAAGTAMTEPVYIWNNSGGGAEAPQLNDYDPDECGHNLHTATFVQAGRDYVLGPKPGYTKYTYPHPLRAGSSGTPTQTAPAAPTNLRIISGAAAVTFFVPAALDVDEARRRRRQLTGRERS